jgi:nitroreductase
MNVMDAIKTRRSIGKVKPDPVETELIKTILEAAVWAPNHLNTEPWRFFVMTGEGRRILGQAYADIAQESASIRSEAELAELRKKNEAKAFRAPVVIAVAAIPSEQPKIPFIEELAAVHAAVQNMLLAAHALGLGAIWRTGDPTYHPKMRQAFGLNEHEQLVGFIYIGYPDMAEPKAERTPLEQKTVWLDAVQKL